MYISFNEYKQFYHDFLWHQYMEIFWEKLHFFQKKNPHFESVCRRLDFHNERKVDKAVQKTGLRRKIIARDTNQQESGQR